MFFVFFQGLGWCWISWFTSDTDTQPRCSCLRWHYTSELLRSAAVYSVTCCPAHWTISNTLRCVLVSLCMLWVIDVGCDSVHIQVDTLCHTLSPLLSVESCSYCFFPDESHLFSSLPCLCFSSLFLVDVILSCTLEPPVIMAAFDIQW